MGGALSSLLLDRQLDGRLLDEPSPIDPPSLICQPMQVLRTSSTQPDIQYILYGQLAVCTVSTSDSTWVQAVRKPAWRL